MEVQKEIRITSDESLESNYYYIIDDCIILK